MLDLDLDVLCGMQEADIFAFLDPEGTGAIELDSLLKPAGFDPEGALPSAPMELRPKAQAKWALIARWMGIATLRANALRKERMRRGWRVAGNIEAVQSSEEAVPEKASGVIQQQGLDAVKERSQVALLRSAVQLKKLETPLRSVFAAAVKERSAEGSQLVSQTDLRAFFDDLPMADAPRATSVAQASGAALPDRAFEEAMKVQVESTKTSQNGLVFWSFKAALSSMVEDFSLGWPALVEHLVADGTHEH
eukprot:CAMPEP_0197681748 /NCGR_PEP_ID=MMETSP1338-20131121/95407_1 /TAXON_ID=43686 ORGANISM="Pelagodinium beii, Strain RCC1491" /NCGR_SAMPLE_ID=MMETSP1338 /ASSEMBLY_ACC=CAM_ASM_000754 /LENGTH=249 /DNA_ID=CAMNT_0043263129 /DNA_START=12 /DNA_END=761 /DNA_ORIENTATION=+